MPEMRRRGNASERRRTRAHLSPQTRVAVTPRSCEPGRLVDAALGFASERDVVTYEDAARLLEALREVLGAVHPDRAAVLDVDHFLVDLFEDATCRRRDLVDALLDLRRAVDGDAAARRRGRVRLQG
jgi:hypothetical protein